MVAAPDDRAIIPTPKTLIRVTILVGMTLLGREEAAEAPDTSSSESPAAE
ncbi:MAG: hypothetical protein ACI9WU_003568 [Myxococcota bacterium]|jgi:hypothetical protein